jgi:hypothetical protein
MSESVDENGFASGKLSDVEDHLNSIASAGVHGGAEAIHKFMEENTHKDPYVRLASLVGALLAMIPQQVVVDNCSWDKDTVQAVLSLLYAGIGTDLDKSEPEEMLNNIVEAIESITKGKANCSVIPIQLKKGETIEDYIDERMGKEGYKGADVTEEVWTNVKSGPDSTN